MHGKILFAGEKRVSSVLQLEMEETKPSSSNQTKKAMALFPNALTFEAFKAFQMFAADENGESSVLVVAPSDTIIKSSIDALSKSCELEVSADKWPAIAETEHRIFFENRKIL